MKVIIFISLTKKPKPKETKMKNKKEYVVIFKDETRTEHFVNEDSKIVGGCGIPTFPCKWNAELALENFCKDDNSLKNKCRIEEF
jgi:hypothetical protein